MALSTFSDLSASIGRWLHRGDLASVIPDFITLAEARIYQGSKDAQMPTEALRLVSMEKTVTGNVASGAIVVPSDLIEIRKIAIQDGASSRGLSYATPDEMVRLQRFPGIPVGYTFDGGQMLIGPVGDYDYTMTYLARFPALSATQASNWLLTNAPNVYLYGALVEAAPYLNNDPRMATWYRLFAAALNAVQATDDDMRYGPGLRMHAS